MKNISIRSLGITTIIIIAIFGVISVVSSWSTHKQSDESLGIWTWYEDISSPRALALSSIVTNIGYGGVVHQFKDYILRQDRNQIAKIQTQIGGALAAIEQYKAAAISDKELMALDNIHNALLKYLSGLTTARRMIGMEQEIGDIVSRISIDDQPIIQGLETLRSLASSTSSGAENRTTKANLIARLRVAMGFDGLIHHYKDYILTHNASLVQRIKESAANVVAVIGDFRTTEISAKEAKALDDIEKVVNKYLASSSEIGTYISDGYSPKKIDTQVAINDGPAFEGISTLVAAAAAEARTSQNLLTANLNWVQKLSFIGLILAVTSIFVIGGLTAYVLIARIVRPLKRMEKNMTDLAGGNVEVEIFGADRKDEIGDMGKAVEIFKQNSTEMQRMEADRVETETKTQEQRRSDMLALANSFEENVGSVVDTITLTVTELEETADTLNQTADIGKGQADTVTSAAAKSSESVTIVASAAQELDASIREIATKANQSRKVSTEALTTSESAKSTMQELVDGASRVNTIVDLINDIADQTNLLALNATIEASRAGDAGKGFAVVASEVKALAQQTAKATEEIATQIGALQSTSSTAVEEIDSVNTIIANIDELTAGIADVIEEQANVTNEISQSILNAAAVTDEVTQGMQAVKGASNDTEEAATQMHSAMQVMRKENEQLNVRIQTFLGNVRAA